MNLVDKIIDLQSQMDDLAQKLLDSNYEKVKHFMFTLGSANYTVTMKSGRVGRSKDDKLFLVVDYINHRKDPLFDDYETSDWIPLDYLTCSNYKKYISNIRKDQEEKIAKEHWAKKEKEYSTIKFRLKQDEAELNKLRKELGY